MEDSRDWRDWPCEIEPTASIPLGLCSVFAAALTRQTLAPRLNPEHTMDPSPIPDSAAAHNTLRYNSPSDPWPTSHPSHAMAVWRRRVAQRGTRWRCAGDSEGPARSQWGAVAAEGERQTGVDPAVQVREGRCHGEWACWTVYSSALQLWAGGEEWLCMGLQWTVVNLGGTQ